MEHAQRGFQLLFHFSIFNLFLVPMPFLVKQTKVVAIGETGFIGLQFNPPAPELTFFRRWLDVDADRQAVKEKAVVLTLPFAQVRAQAGKAFH
ncbi:hypothetical protein D3C76_1452660 [compost metagenome]